MVISVFFFFFRTDEILGKAGLNSVNTNLAIPKTSIPLSTVALTEYTGETKRQRSERFGEHRRSILSHHQLNNLTPVSLHLNQPAY